MSISQGSIGFQNLQSVQGPPFSIVSADNGLSVDPVTGRIVLGQSVGEVGNPAILLSAREIPMDGNNFQMVDGPGSDIQLFIDPATQFYQFGSPTAGNQYHLEINSTGSTWNLGQPSALNTNRLFHNLAGGIELGYADQLTNLRLLVGDSAFGYSLLASPDLHTDVQLLDAANGNMAVLNANNGGAISCTAGSDGSNGHFSITATTTTYFLRFNAALTNHAAAAVGTLNNSPVAGNPTKWIGINDNGTIRRIPTW